MSTRIQFNGMFISIPNTPQAGTTIPKYSTVRNVCLGYFHSFNIPIPMQSIAKPQKALITKVKNAINDSPFRKAMKNKIMPADRLIHLEIPF